MMECNDASIATGCKTTDTELTPQGARPHAEPRSRVLRNTTLIARNMR